MSSKEKGESSDEKSDQSSLDEENYQTEDEMSDESISMSITKIKGITITKNRKNLKNLKKGTRKKYTNHNHYFRAKYEFRKYLTRSTGKTFVKNWKTLESPSLTPKKGKRCRSGGKAKGKPPKEESRDKHDSDEETDNGYYSRISLGYFQKFRDKNGASTSYQLREEYKNSVVLPLTSLEKLQEKTSEEMELLELQRWGRTNLVSPNKESEKLKRNKDIRPDTV